MTKVSNELYSLLFYMLCNDLPQFSCLKQHTSILSQFLWTRSAWVNQALCKSAIKMLARVGFSSGASVG